MSKFNKYQKSDPKESEYWHKVLLKNAQSHSEILASFLFDLGAIGMEETETALIVYFQPKCDLDALNDRLREVIEKLEQENMIPDSIQIVFDTVKQENWQQNWMKYFKPIHIGDRLVIVPSWKKLKPKEDQIVLTIDPQQAFGTGSHATTHMMLQSLLKYCRKDLQVLDVGTGSGILAITASKLGCAYIVAFDSDPIAVQTAVQNAQTNGVADKIHFYTGGLSTLYSDQQFDVILVNINSTAIQNLLPHLNNYLKNVDHLMILSGILEEEKEKMTQSIEQYHYQLIEELEKEEWLCLVCKKKK